MIIFQCPSFEISLALLQHLLHSPRCSRLHFKQVLRCIIEALLVIFSLLPLILLLMERIVYRTNTLVLLGSWGYIKLTFTDLIGPTEPE